jgi:hypothetical protein
MQCNIDARGKAVRLGWGSVFLVIGICLALWWARSADSAIAWIASSAVMLAGAFMIFEGRKGWCIVRAMGFKTPL